MSRPESIKDIDPQDRLVRIAAFEIDKIVDNAALLKHYTGLLEVVQKLGGKAEKLYSNVDISIPKNKDQLEQQLRMDQHQWDEMQKYYNLALNRGVNSDEIPEWRHEGIKRWAKKEGLPDPFDVFAANDPELAALRADLGMEDD